MKTWQYPYIVIATENSNKLKQFQELFSYELGLEVKGLKDFPNAPEIIEDQATFEGNAVKKAEIIANWLGQPVVSDDSGLVVPALGGEPGVYSARYAGEPKSDDRNNQKLISKIRELPESERAGFYVCVMALAVPEEESQVVRGECNGVIIDTPRGHLGFGYDPIFYLSNRKMTMAELPNEQKFEISHRAQATKQLIEVLKQTYIFQQ